MGTTKSLQKLFLEELYDLYSVEKQNITALTKMLKKANDQKLKSALEDHINETKNQKERLEKVFEIIGRKARSKKCKGVEGIIEEGEEMIAASDDGAIMDAVIISAAQKVEHYEIAGYGTITQLAKELGHKDAADHLAETLKEEKETDKKLTRLAKSSINQAAKS